MGNGVRAGGTITFLWSTPASPRPKSQRGPTVHRRTLEPSVEILRAAAARHGGVERGSLGDSLLLLFGAASSAIEAAVEVQRAIDERSSSEPEACGIRIGVHTGSATVEGDAYLGLDVHRASRIAEAAHGGQVLLSEASYHLVARQLPAGVRARSLGRYRLRDLSEPERLWQLEIAGLHGEFPPLRALDVQRAQLPPDATSFIGREAELDGIARLVRSRRLVTLTGAGGTGKTRLALRSASRVVDGFDDGAFFVPLANVADATLMAGVVGSMLGLPDDAPAAAAVAEWLHERDMLLVLDNLEQIPGAGQVVAGWLDAAPGLRVLATSRSRLGITGEQEYPIAPFATVAPGADASEIEGADAVRLFVDRARLVQPDLVFEAPDLAVVADVTRQVDGLALGIELAAARVRMLPLPEIRDLLARPLDTLVGGPADAPARQRSLRDTIAWSHGLLDAASQALLARLSTFAGGWTLDAAAEVGEGGPVDDVESALATLVDHSLVHRVPTVGSGRYAMLPTIADFAAQQLDRSGDRPAVERKFVRYFRRLAEGALAHADGPEADAWFDRVEADLDNIRAAIRCSTDAGERDQALGIAAALRPFWLRRNHGGEGLQILDSVSAPATPPYSLEFAAATAAAAAIGDWLGAYAVVRRVGARSVEAYRQLGDRSGFADALASLAFATIEVDPKAALELNAESYAAYRAVGDARGEGQALLGRATALFALGDLAATRETLEQSLALLRATGDAYFALFCAVFLGRIKLLMGDAAEGLADYQGVLDASRQIDLGLGTAIALEYLAEVAIWNGDPARAVRIGAAAARLKEQLGGGVPPRIGGGIDPIAAGRDRLSADEYASQIAAGRALDIDEIVAEAKGVAPPGRRETVRRPVEVEHGARPTWVPPSPPADAAVASATTATLVREGEVWAITFNGRTTRLRDSKGLRYLARLLVAPDTEILAVDLVVGAGSGRSPVGPRMSAARLAGAGLSARPAAPDPMLDARARAEYRGRLIELQHEIEEADAAADPERASRARAEFQLITDELAAAVGLGGRSRQARSAAERARVSVTKAIRDALVRIERNDAELGAHLRRTIRTGTLCAYHSDSRTRVRWLVS